MKKLTLSLLLGALVLSGCIGGLVLGVGAKCEGSTALITQVSGECVREIEELAEAETQSIAVQTSEFMPFADVSYVIEVGTGELEATFVDSNGNPRTVTIKPSEPASGVITVQVDSFNQIKFDLKPVGGPAKNVSWEVNFVCDCLP